MTIAVGFPCVGGIVLCADSQMTCRESSTKYEDAKIHTAMFMGGGNDWTLGVAYAGDEGVVACSRHFLGNLWRDILRLAAVETPQFVKLNATAREIVEDAVLIGLANLADFTQKPHDRFLGDSRHADGCAN